MRWLLIVSLAIASCGDSAPSIDAAGNDARISGCANFMQHHPVCPNTCGNGTIDTCSTLHPGKTGCIELVTTEACDGATFTCESLGYFGGTSSCTSTCTRDTRNCTACLVGGAIASCETIAGTSSFTMVSNADEQALLIGSEIYQRSGGVLVRTATPPITFYDRVVGVAGGWLVRNSSQLRAVNTAGAIIGTKTLPSTSVEMTFGAGGRVLIGWIVVVGAQYRTAIMIVDPIGDTIVAQHQVPITMPSARFALGSDGTSFFLATEDALVRLNADGDVVSQSPAPSAGAAVVAIAANAQSRWLVRTGSAGYSVIPFDAGGALAAPIPVAFGAPGTELAAWTARGTNLFVRAYESHVDDTGHNPAPTQTVLRIASDGAIVARPTVAGINGTLAVLGPDLLLGWTVDDTRHIAVITP